MASAAARSPLAVSAQTVHTLTAVRAASRRSLTPGQVATTLDELEAMGFIEKFRDEHNVARYRPRLVAAKRSVA